MKFKWNISALFLAGIVLFSANGVALFEHICSTSNTKSFQAFIKPTCENEAPVSSCCTKIESKKTKKDCCSHKQFFSKLSIEGFVAKQLELKSNIEKFIQKFDFNYPYSHFFSSITVHYFSGLPPPDNLYYYVIQTSLQPTSTKLQIFRC